MSTEDYLGLEPLLFKELWEACRDGHPEKIAQLWLREPDALAAVRVVAHDPTGTTQSSLRSALPVEGAFEAVVWLRSLYSSEAELRFYDARTASSLLPGSGDMVDLRLDPVFLCDANIVSYCRALWEREPLAANVAHMLRAAHSLVSLHRRGYFDPVCYVHENLGRLAVEPREQEEIIFRRLAGFYLWLRTPASEFKDGVVTSKGLRAEWCRRVCGHRARSRLRQWKQFLANGGHDRARIGSKLTRLALLRAVYERWNAPADHPMAKKVMNLLTFFDEQAFVMPKIELAVALHWFEAGKLPGFFNPLKPNTRSDKLFKKIGAMAWDLVHLREAALWAATGPKQPRKKPAEITAPYLLTADRDFASFLPALQIKALLTRRASSRYETVLFGEEVMDRAVRLTNGECRRFFNLQASARRASHMPADADAREALIDALIKDTETELRSFHTLTPRP